MRTAYKLTNLLYVTIVCTIIYLNLGRIRPRLASAHQAVDLISFKDTIMGAKVVAACVAT